MGLKFCVWGWFALTAQLWAASGFREGNFSDCRRYFEYLSAESAFITNQKFEEQSSTANAGSWKAEHALFHARLLDLFQKYSNFTEFLPDQIEVGTPMSELLEKSRFARNYVAVEVRRLSQRYADGFATSGKPKFLETLKRLVARVDESAAYLELYSPEEAASRGLAFPWYKALDFQKFQRELDLYTGQTFEAKADQLNALAKVGGSLNSFWGELRAASLVPNLLATNHHLESAHDFLGVEKNRLHALPRELANREIDIVWRDSIPRRNPFDAFYGWGEVKTLFHVLDTTNAFAHHWEKLTRSIQDQKQAARILNLKIRFHIFVTNGMTLQAKRRLMGMGFHGIHGLVESEPEGVR